MFNCISERSEYFEFVRAKDSREAHSKLINPPHDVQIEPCGDDLRDKGYTWDRKTDTFHPAYDRFYYLNH